MLTLVDQSCEPCKPSGWPNICRKEWSVANHPSLKVLLSYYSGTDVKPLSFISILDKVTGKASPAQEHIPNQLDRYEDHVPYEYEVERQVADALDKAGL